MVKFVVSGTSTFDLIEQNTPGDMASAYAYHRITYGSGHLKVNLELGFRKDLIKKDKFTKKS